ncbi:ribonuclease H [Senna tora]|uniref:Ribonuclease H n=1 Tax=Senna tora TaxID=362788 RepID=A0A834TZ14_9FABA|nr:ribonuclease H [Senna tora]
MLQDHVGITAVSDLIKHDSNSWNQELLFSLYDLHVAQIISKIPLSITSVQDRLCWKLSRDGTYNVKDSYQFLLLQGNNSDNGHGIHSDNFKMWKVLWRLKLPLRVIVFLWRLLYVNFLELFRLALMSLHHNLLPNTDATAWLMHELVNTGVSNHEHDDRFICITLHSLWYYRNQRVMEAVVFWHQQLFVRFDTRVTNWNQCFPSFLSLIRKGIHVVDQNGTHPKFCHLFVPNLVFKNLLLEDYRNHHNCKVLGQDICNITSNFQGFKVSVDFPPLWGSEIPINLPRPSTQGLGCRF